jgi:hypothetical protein
MKLAKAEPLAFQNKKATQIYLVAFLSFITQYPIALDRGEYRSRTGDLLPARLKLSSMFNFKKLGKLLIFNKVCTFRIIIYHLISNGRKKK